MTQPDHEATAMLETLALRELAAEYERINWSRFREALRRPSFRLTDTRTVLGRWCGEERCIEIARTLLHEQSWGVVVEVLMHEMAHQYVDEVLRARDVAAHGTLFRDVCRKFHVDGRARGLPEEPADAARSAVLDKVSKLLALATSPNPHEAESAMRAARRLMLKCNLERSEQDRARGYVWRHLGEPSKRVETHRGLASMILESHFFVQAIWISVWDVRDARRGTVLEVCGTPANVDLAAYVYSFLVHTAEGLWAAQRRSGVKGGLSARRSFLRGVMLGFGQKLAAEGTREREAGLVWVADPDLDAYFRGRNPRVRQRRSHGQHDAEAHARGRAAGERLVLHKAFETTTREVGKQLGSGSR